MELKNKLKYLKKFFKRTLTQKILVGFNIFIMVCYLLLTYNTGLKEEFLRTNTTYWLPVVPVIIFILFWVGTYISYKKRIK